MSVDTPFMEPETGIALLDAIGDAISLKEEMLKFIVQGEFPNP